jgi:hypothetical protein
MTCPGSLPKVRHFPITILDLVLHNRPCGRNVTLSFSISKQFSNRHVPFFSLFQHWANNRQPLALRYEVERMRSELSKFMLVCIGSATLLSACSNAFVSIASFKSSVSRSDRAYGTSHSSSALFSTEAKAKTLFDTVDERTGKPTGTSFLPADVVELAAKGNPIEKAKLAKDGTSAFIDVYEYARKIREGEMTWEEVEKADLDTVRCLFSTSQLSSVAREFCLLYRRSCSSHTRPSLVFCLCYFRDSSTSVCCTAASAHPVNS